MKRHQAKPRRDLDMSIRNDELEHSRRLLEQKLKSTSIGVPVASSDDDGDDGQDHHHFQRHHHYHNDDDEESSVEYPRHDAGAIPYPEFPSFAHRSGEFVEADSQMHGWSYRTVDNDEGVNPYENGETASSAAHHASALTITAGLGLGGRGGRRDISLSGAEYDPERPLNQIMSGVGRMSMFDDPSRSRNNPNVTATFEPLVVDSTAELDRILQSGYAPQVSLHSIHPTPPMSHASSSSSDSESLAGSPSRARLADHLRNVPFSPKRPRTAQTLASPMSKKKTSTPPAENATPRPSKRAVSSGNKTPIAQPEVRLQPPTPSTVSSKFTRMARGIAKDIDDEANRPPPAASQRPSTQPRKANETPRKEGSGASKSQRRVASKSELSKSRIHLPDVTGLTMAIETPLKPGNEYKAYRNDGIPRETEVRLLQTFNTVQNKLHQLNEENTISRRRMHELEMELDDCKREVTKNRSLLLEREELVLRQEKELHRIKKDIKGKGKVRQQEQDEEQEAVTKRYKDAVEEKKALEALINGLRTHLTRLTSELASHQELLHELREFRAEDVQSMKQKGEEIKKLNDEVERLAGEVEVLRGVVEEGLRERRATREASMMASEADVGMSRDEESEDERPDEPRAAERSFHVEDDSEEEREQDQDQEDDEEEDLEDFESTRDADESRAQLADRTLRTDHATLGSSRSMSTPTAPRATAPTPTRAASVPYARAGSTPHRSRVQFVDQSELEEIQAEVEERRSNVSSRSNSPPREFGHQSTPRRERDHQSTPRRNRYADATRQVESLVEVDVDMTRMGVRTPSPDPRQTSSGTRLDWWARGNEDGERSPSPMPRKGGMAKLQQQLQKEKEKQKASKPSQQPVAERPRNPPPPPSNASVQAQPASSMRVSSPRVHHQPPPAVRDSPKAQAQPKRNEAPVLPVDAPFPQIRGERLEKLFFSAPEHNPETCTVCYRRRGREDVQRSLSYIPGRSAPSQQRRGATVQDEEDEDEGFEEGTSDHERVGARGGWSSSAANPNVYKKEAQKKGVPPQTVVMRVVRDLEDDFTHYKSVYVELADQYKDMDAASDVPRRNMLAKHLREVVDILEQKGDQIASLYELVSFKDKPAGASGVPSTRRA
ncbi:hypothetical protein BKA70DRAFT_861565 [Coprinopsis sp. MPI-PUGE-AT-0042]|nr:hypothetical protein BKA70DRAFT_861565 [Coprinopsis sp. MPI-PUGE-AT-0042]